MSYYCQFNAGSGVSSLAVVASILLNDDLKPKFVIILPFLLTAKHRVCQSVQQCCPSSPSILSRCWCVLVSGERRLLPSVCRQRMWRKLQRAEWAHYVSHGGLWRMDKNHHCYSKISCIQVATIFIMCHSCCFLRAYIYLDIFISYILVT